jgi:hypothetical protein
MQASEAEQIKKILMQKEVKELWEATRNSVRKRDLK